MDSLAAQLPASLGLDADTLDASPRRIPRPGVDNYGRRRDVFHRPHQPVKGQSSARVSNPRAKTHFHGVSISFRYKKLGRTFKHMKNASHVFGLMVHSWDVSSDIATSKEFQHNMWDHELAATCRSQDFGKTSEQDSSP